MKAISCGVMVMVTLLTGCVDDVADARQSVEVIDDDPGDPGDEGTGQEIIWTSVDRATAEVATLRSLEQYTASYGAALVSARCSWEGVAPGDPGNYTGTVRWRYTCRVTGYQCYFWEGTGIRDISCSRTYGGWYVVGDVDAESAVNAADDDPGDPGDDGTGEEFVWATDVPQVVAESEAQAAVEFLHADADSPVTDSTSYPICRWQYNWMGELQLRCALGYARCTWIPTRFGYGTVLCSWALDYRDPRIDPAWDDVPSALVAPSMIDDDPGDEEGTPWVLVQTDVDPSEAEAATSDWADVMDGMAASGCAWDGPDLYVCNGFRSRCVFFLSLFTIWCKAR